MKLTKLVSIRDFSGKRKKISSLGLALYSLGSSLTQTGSSSVLELLETIGNSDHHKNFLGTSRQLALYLSLAP